jgi:hypothetical protein
MTTHRVDGGPSPAAALDVALDEAAAAQAEANAAAGRRTLALSRALAAAAGAESSLLDVESVRVRSTTAQRRASVAHRALVAEVACALGVTEHAARSLLADAEVLGGRAVATLDALCAGRISYAHATRLADAVADLPVAVVREVEAAVLERAGALSPARFGALVRAARERLHTVPAEVRHEAAQLKADVWLDDGKDGMSWLTAYLPAAAAHAAYDRLARTAASARADGDPRGVGQLRAAACAALLLDGPRLTGADSALPVGGGPVAGAAVGGGAGPRSDGQPREVPDLLSTIARNVRPTVHVTVPVAALTGHGEQSATIDGATPVDAETARRLTSLAPTLRRVLTDPVDGALLSVDRGRYVVPAGLRAFLTERDVTCRFPGCRIPARRCDVDHTVDWADGGGTDATNLAHLCRGHHTLKHESRWQVEQLDAGVLAWTSPRGRTYLTRPGSAEHVAGHLDAWAHEAAAVVTELVPIPADRPPGGPAATDRPPDGTPSVGTPPDRTSPDGARRDRATRVDTSRADPTGGRASRHGGERDSPAVGDPPF